MAGPDLTLDQRRQQANLAFIASGAEFTLGDARALPLDVSALKALRLDSPGVEALHDGGLTAEVLCLHHAGRRWAIKRARAECRVRNPDGATSFLNELQRHGELAARQPLPGIAAPAYGSLRHGLLVSPWIDGRHPGVLDERQARSLLQAGCALIEHGFFEWDYSAGNLLDDGTRLWLYDFGYCYRFDPLTQFNSAGHGHDHPQHHLAERIEGRHLFGALLDAGSDAAALPHFVAFKRLAAQAYEGLADRLAARGATAPVLGHYRGLAQRWRDGLALAPAQLYLADAWQAHRSDLDDDLRGRSCTPRTLRRARWLQQAWRAHAAALRASGALSAEDAARSDAALLQHLCEQEHEAMRWQL